MMTTPYPNFFIVGAPKSGTTALAEYLSTHTQVFFSALKEPEFFATDFAGRNVSTLDAYLKLFENAMPEKHLAIGEGSVVYLFSEEAIPNIMKFQPTAKIIVVLRNPIDLVISLHIQRLNDGVENISDFYDAWCAENERREGRNLPPLSGRDPKLVYYSEWGRLGTQLQRCMEIVPSAQLKVILFDDFVQSPQRIYQDVLRFLGLPDDGRRNFPRVNEARVPRLVFLNRMLRKTMTLWMPLKVYILKGKGLGLGNWLRGIFSTPLREQYRNSINRAPLIEYYQDEIRMLETLLHRSLQHWMEQEDDFK